MGKNMSTFKIMFIYPLIKEIGKKEKYNFDEPIKISKSKKSITLRDNNLIFIRKYLESIWRNVKTSIM